LHQIIQIAHGGVSVTRDLDKLFGREIQNQKSNQITLLATAPLIRSTARGASSLQLQCKYVQLIPIKQIIFEVFQICVRTSLNRVTDGRTDRWHAIS